MRCGGFLKYPQSSSISNDGIFHEINHPAIKGYRHDELETPMWGPWIHSARMMKIENATGRAVVWNRKSLLQAIFQGTWDQRFHGTWITWMWPHLVVYSPYIENISTLFHPRCGIFHESKWGGPKEAPRRHPVDQIWWVANVVSKSRFSGVVRLVN